MPDRTQDKPLNKSGANRSSVEPATSDLTMLVVMEQGERSFRIYLTAADPALRVQGKPFGAISFATDPVEYFRFFFKDLQQFDGLDRQREFDWKIL